MKLLPGIGEYDLPPIGQIVGMVIDERRLSPDGVWVRLIMVAPAELVRMQAENRKPGAPDVRGCPTYFALFGAQMIHVFPAPDREYEARLRFYPPMEEI